jgi:hypothetical protein
MCFAIHREIDTHTHTHTHVWVCSCIYIHVRTQTYTCARICIYMHECLTVVYSQDCIQSVGMCIQVFMYTHISRDETIPSAHREGWLVCIFVWMYGCTVTHTYAHANNQLMYTVNSLALVHSSAPATYMHTRRLSLAQVALRLP